MAVKWTTQKDLFPSVKKSADVLNGRKIHVGCLKGSHQWLAAIHEYGCRIPVTPKMRAYLHHIGIHLKPTTNVIIIPERSFIRAGHDEVINQVLDHAETLYGKVISGKLDEEKFLKTLGLELASLIKEYATNLDDPANSSATVKLKGSDNPLWDTGQMIRGISHEIE